MVVHAERMVLLVISTILRPGAESFTAQVYINYLKEILASLQQAGKELVEQGKVSKRIIFTP